MYIFCSISQQTHFLRIYSFLSSLSCFQGLFFHKVIDKMCVFFLYDVLQGGVKSRSQLNVYKNNHKSMRQKPEHRFQKIVLDMLRQGVHTHTINKAAARVHMHLYNVWLCVCVW